MIWVNERGRILSASTHTQAPPHLDTPAHTPLPQPSGQPPGPGGALAALQPDRVGALFPLSAAAPHAHPHAHPGAPSPPTHALALAGAATPADGGQVKWARQPPPVVATPDGELIFTDSAGVVQRRHLLDFPAVAAFRVDIDGGGGDGVASLLATVVPGGGQGVGHGVGAVGGPNAPGGGARAALVRTRPGYAVAPLQIVHRLSAVDANHGHGHSHSHSHGHDGDGGVGGCVGEADDDRYPEGGGEGRVLYANRRRACALWPVGIHSQSNG